MLGPICGLLCAVCGVFLGAASVPTNLGTQVLSGSHQSRRRTCFHGAYRQNTQPPAAEQPKKELQKRRRSFGRGARGGFGFPSVPPFGW